MQSLTQSKHALAIVGMLFITVLWGGSFAAMKVLINAQVGVGAMLTLRFALGAACLGLFLLARRVPIRRQALRDGVVLGLVLTCVFWLQADGLRYTTTSKSGFITGLYVVFTPLVSLGWGHRPRISHALGAAFAALGLFLLVRDPIQGMGGWNFGDTETLLCALGCGFHIFMTTLFSRRSDVLVLAFLQVAVVAVASFLLSLLLPPAPLADGKLLGGFAGLGPLLRDPQVWVTVLYLGLMATALCFLLMTACQKYVGATEAAIVYTGEPVLTSLLAMSGWVPGVKEHLLPTQLLGGGIIIGAMLLAELGPRFFRGPREKVDEVG